MADKNFTIKNKRGVDVPVPEWLYNINNIKGVVVKLPTYELAFRSAVRHKIRCSKLSLLVLFRTSLSRRRRRRVASRSK